MLIPVITGATGSISESFRKYLCNIPGKHEFKELQKTAILGPAKALWKVLMYKYLKNIIYTIYRRNVVCFKYVILNILHKGE